MCIDGLILAGGKSSRMGGRHKGNLRYHEQTFQEHVIEEFQKEAEEIFISYGDKVQEECPGCQIIMDEIKGIGPIGGLCEGLKNCRKDLVMVAACDMPLIRIDIYRDMYQKLKEEETLKEEQYDVALPVVEGKTHPLAAIYRVTALPTIEKQIQEKDYRLMNAIGKMHVLYIDMTNRPDFRLMLSNINTVEEYQRLCQENGAREA
jgi:molybdopterin-guanine dinucleotide biosynthesis protein A